MLIASLVLSPDMFDKGTRYLDLSGVPFKNFIQLTTSIESNLDKVVFLNMSNCNMESLQIVTWTRLSFYGEERPRQGSKNFLNVAFVDLSYNNIENFHGYFPSYIYKDKYWIWTSEFLDLSHNSKLTLSFDPEVRDLIDFDTFTVKSLDLSFTSVSEKDGFILSQLPYLENLNLKGCPIANLKPILPSTVQSLDLQNIDITAFSSGLLDNFENIKTIYATSSKVCCPQVRGNRSPGNLYLCFIFFLILYVLLSISNLHAFE